MLWFLISIAYRDALENILVKDASCKPCRQTKLGFKMRISFQLIEKLVIYEYWKSI